MLEIPRGEPGCLRECSGVVSGKHCKAPRRYDTSGAWKGRFVATQRDQLTSQAFENQHGTEGVSGSSTAGSDAPSRWRFTDEELRTHREREAKEFVEAAERSDPVTPDVPEMISLIGVPWAVPSVSGRPWEETRALRKVAKAREVYLGKAFQVVRRNISLMRRLAEVVPEQAEWVELTRQIDEFHSAFAHGRKSEPFQRLLVLQAVDRAASHALPMLYAMAVARKQTKAALPSDRRLLNRPPKGAAEYLLSQFNLDCAENMTTARARDLLEEPFDPFGNAAPLVWIEVERQGRPQQAQKLEEHRRSVLELLREWPIHSVPGRARSATKATVAKKWSLAAELMCKVGLAKVDPETLRQEWVAWRKEKRDRGAKFTKL